MPSYNTQVVTGRNYITIYEGTDLDVGARQVHEPISGRTVHHQTAVIVPGQLEFTDTPQVGDVNATGLYPPTSQDGIPIAGMGAVIIRTLFDVNTAGSNPASVKLKVLLYTASGKLIGLSDEHTVEADSDGQDSSGKYVGNIVVLDNSKLGASVVRILVKEINVDSGTIHFYIGGF